MSKRTYNHLEFRSKYSPARFSRGGRPISGNLPVRPDDYYIHKRKELEAIKLKLIKEKKPLSKILKISGEAEKDFLFERLP